MTGPKSMNYDLVIFRHFLNFKLFFGPFLGTVVKNAKHKKVVPGINLTNPSVNVWVPQMRFPIMYLLNSSTAHAQCGLIKNTYNSKCPLSGG